MTALLTILAAISLSFNHLFYRDGMTTGSVTDICFDSNGVVWIATGNGLNSYDGNTVRNHPSATGNSVMRLASDGDRTLYVASLGELYSLNLNTMEHVTVSQDNSRAIAWFEGSLYVAVGNELKRYSPGKSLPEVVAVFSDSDEITALSLSSEGTAWMGTQNGDVICYGLKSPRSRRWNVGSLVENVFIDSRGFVWAATYSSGMSAIGPDETVRNYRHSPSDANTLSTDFVRSICEDDNGRYWIGTFAGLDCYDPSDGSFSHYTPDRIRPESLSNSSVWVVRKDAQGSIWAGTFFGGVNYFNPEYSIYTKYPVSPYEGVGLSSDIIRKIDLTDSGEIMVATEGGGFNIIDPLTFRSVWYNKTTKESISENNVKAFVYDRDNSCIWLGTHMGGLDRIDLRTGRSRPFRNAGKPGDNPDTDDVLSLADGGDSLYLGTTEGFFLVSKKTAAYRRISSHQVNSIVVLQDGSVWYTDRNLCSYNPGTRSARTVLPDKNISCICPLEDGTLALGTRKSPGIIIFNPADETSYAIDMSSVWTGLERASGIVQSNLSGRLLVSSDKGFATVGLEDGNIEYHSSSTGFPLDNTSDNAIMQTAAGTVFVGGISGLVSFPESGLEKAPRPYSIAFSRLLTDDGSEKVILYERNLVIPCGVSAFSVEVISSNHIAGNSSPLEYRMDGLSRKWAPLPTNNRISFANVPYGKYTLRARASGADNSVCREISIAMRVLPPWYVSLPAKLFYTLVVFLGAILALRKLIRYLKKREAEKMAALSKVNAEKFRILEKATSVAYGNLDNVDFNVAEFASEMALSRSALFDKIKETTGKTPNEFILDIRMNEALRLIENNPDMNVSDVAYRVGFASPHYFSKVFSGRFGASPVTWRKSHSNKKQTSNK